MQFIRSFLTTKVGNEFLAKHVGLSILYKGGAILTTFLMVPLSIRYLGSGKYGLWLTIYSFIGWFGFFDMGIGHGLRNKLAEAWANNDFELGRKYVSTAYFSILFVVAVLMLVVFLVFPHISWANIFKTDYEFIDRVVLISYLLFSANMLASLISVIFLADHRASIPGIIQFAIQVLCLLGIYLLMTIEQESLLLYAIVILGSQIAVFLISSTVAFGRRYKHVKPNIGYFESGVLRDLFTLSSSFFVIQVAYMLIFTTDNYIINYFFGAESVTVYNVVYKYFMIPFILINLLTAPYWSAFTDAYAKKDFEWARTSLMNLLKFSLLISGGTIIMIFVSDFFYSIWVGDSIDVPFSLSLIVGVNTILLVILEPFFMLINGFGKLRIQLITGLVLSSINIPLSIILGEYFNLGIQGVVLASVFCTIVGCFIYPAQAFKILNNKALGIWNK